MGSKKCSLKDLPTLERPRERLLNLGVKSLSITELIILILGRGTYNHRVEEIASSITEALNSSKNFGENIRPEELAKIPGVGKAKACQICAAIEIGKRSYKRAESKVVYKPDAIKKIIKPFFQSGSVETLFVVSLDSRKKVLGVDKIGVGSVNEVVAHPREIFKKAINRMATYIVLVHNHPSGDHEPSANDLAITERVLSVSKIIGIPLLDHVIIGNSGFTSMKKEEYIL